MLYNYITENKEEIIINNPYVYYKGKLIYIDDYIPLIKNNGNYAGDFECNIMTKIINFNILVLKYYEDTSISENYYIFLNYYGKLDEKKYVPLCILEYIESESHYQLLYFNDNYIGTELTLNNDNNNEVNINDNKSSNSQDKDKYHKIKKTEKENQIENKEYKIKDNIRSFKISSFNINISQVKKDTNSNREKISCKVNRDLENVNNYIKC